MSLDDDKGKAEVEFEPVKSSSDSSNDDVSTLQEISPGTMQKKMLKW